MSIKIAFSGKGGVGKTTIASLFINALAKDGMHVLAVDCDPVTSLGRFLGIKEADKIVPIVEMKELIDERTEASKDRLFYKLNPKVDDIPDRFAKQLGNIKLIVMGTVRQGGSGCMCPESSFVKALLSRCLLQKNESVVMDMEAGVEHLGRATADFVDYLFIVTEPSSSSIEAVKKIANLAKDIKIKNISVILNKHRAPKELDFVKRNISPLPLAGAIPFDDKLMEWEMGDEINLKDLDAYKIVIDMKNKILQKEI